MRAWIDELSNCTMHQALVRCNDAVQAKDDEDERKERHSITSNESASEELYEFQLALANAIEAVAIALRSWPRIYHMARLSSEVLDVPASMDDSEPPAQMIVLEVVLPTPEARLTPVHSRASGVQAPSLSSARSETNPPPAPFVYTPFSLFSKTQTMLLRGKAQADFARSVTQELSKLYPGRSQDVETELDAAEQSPSSAPHVPSALPSLRKSRQQTEVGDDIDLEKGIRQVSGQIFTVPRGHVSQTGAKSFDHSTGIYAAARQGTDG